MTMDAGNIIGWIGALVIIGLILYSGVRSAQETEKVIDCLKPLAMGICEERNFSYKDHNDEFTICLSDMRKPNLGKEFLYFTEEEIKACGKDGN